MEQHLKNSVSGPSLDVSRQVGNAWGIRRNTDSFHASSDASLFSSSLPVLPHEKLNFTDSGHDGQSVDDGWPTLNKLRQDDGSKDLLGDVEPNIIGSLLPGDEDELLSGIMDDFDLSGLPTQLEDLEDDLFDSGGGMEMDIELQESILNGVSNMSMSDGVPGNGIGQYGLPNGGGTIAGEHPYGEHPSRTLFVRNINSNVEDSELRSLFEVIYVIQELQIASMAARVFLNVAYELYFLTIELEDLFFIDSNGRFLNPLSVQYGDIRTLYTACKHRGFVMISYYDIRAARTAMRALQNKPLRRRKLDIHFSIPKDNPSEKDINQGTLVVFNLDASVSNDDLRQIFGTYGEVKEIRETPHKRHHKFVEYYDVRAAEAALKSLNRSDIAGKRIKLEPSRPGGARRNLMQQLSHELEQEETRTFRHQVGSPLTNSPPGNWTNFSSSAEHSPVQSFSRTPGVETLSPINNNHLPGLASILSNHFSNPLKVAPIGKDQGRGGHLNLVIPNTKGTQGASYMHSHSFSEQKLSVSPGPISPFGESSTNPSGIGTLSGPQFLWGSPTPYSEGTNSSGWQTSSVGLPFASNGQRQGYPYANQHKSFLGSHYHHHVGSAPTGVPLDRHFGYFPESPETSFMSPVAFGSVGFSRTNASYLTNMGVRGPMSVSVAAPGIESGSPSSTMMSMPRNSPVFFGNASYQGQGAISDGLTERGWSRRADYTGNQIENKKQYQLDLDKIINGEDTRTTLMIKNIPNKYTSKMLLAAIDENHMGAYDFLYLPIDFKNKCNVGYAFINMVSPSHIISFYQAFNGKKWEKFNSEKVASLAYARIQGKGALVTHFQNSSLMNEDKRCRPILFQSEGQGAGVFSLQQFKHMYSPARWVLLWGFARKPNRYPIGKAERN
ncbi:hypothetical protein RJ639_028524 [Escallonia herrerae]|uniref:RRM domain-containing protein n=1 Tax=Escallonia herrerae TaxID=1293975 RepID=A0AA89BFI1_9ASTE|nr:hypothetical protein RJ639_028524 [Escallonia herrerae]